MPKSLQMAGEHPHENGGSPTRYGRRELLRRGYALGVSASVLGGGGLLAACSAGGDADRPAADDSTPASAASASRGPVTLEVWQWFTGTGGPDAELYLETLGPTYEETSANSIEWVGQPLGELLPLLTTACRAGTEGDLNYMLPMDSWITIRDCAAVIPESDLSELLPVLSGWADATTRDGQIWGIPLTNQAYIWYYNRALFEQAGLDPEAPPKTWEELSASCEALLAADILPMSIGLRGGNNAKLLVLDAMTQYFETEEIPALRTGELRIDERFGSVLKYTAEMAQNGWWGSQDIYTGKAWFNDVVDEFATGGAAMTIGLITSRSASWKGWDERLGAGAYGIFKTPAFPDATYPGAYGSGASSIISISSATEHYGSALDLAKYLVSAEAQAAALASIGFFPNRSDVDFANVDSSGAQAVRELLASNEPTQLFSPATETSDALANGLGDALESVEAQGAFLENLSIIQAESGE